MKDAGPSKTAVIWETPKTLFYQSGISSAHLKPFFNHHFMCLQIMNHLIMMQYNICTKQIKATSNFKKPFSSLFQHWSLLTGMSVGVIQILTSSFNRLHFRVEACQNQATTKKKKGCMRTKERGDLPSSVSVQQWIWIYVTTILVPTSARALSSASTSNITIHNLAFDCRGKERRENGRRQKRERRRREERSMKSDH